MSSDQNGQERLKTVRASVQLLHQIVDGKKFFALPLSMHIVGPCDGKADGTSCGQGCTCKAGQPWYDFDGITKLGFAPEIGE